MPGNDGVTKTRRQHAILSLVQDERLASQQAIRDRLLEVGLDATQSTISRDIEELGLAKVHDRDGSRYVAPGAVSSAGSIPLLRRALIEFALASVPANGLLILRTPPGAANALAEAVDRADLDVVAGTVAGDNTILVVPADGVSPTAVADTLRAVTEER